MTRILIDANVLMYAAGATHPNKLPSIRLLERVARGEIEAHTDAEVLQEILHRYRSIGRWTEGQRVYDLTRRIIGTVIAIDVELTDAARSLMNAHAQLSARDALHAAACVVAGCDAICSYDRDFDNLDSIRRLEPDALAG